MVCPEALRDCARNIQAWQSLKKLPPRRSSPFCLNILTRPHNRARCPALRCPTTKDMHQTMVCHTPYILPMFIYRCLAPNTINMSSLGLNFRRIVISLSLPPLTLSIPNLHYLISLYLLKFSRFTCKYAFELSVTRSSMRPCN